MGQRRHVTVMFCDLVDSTGIGPCLHRRRKERLSGEFSDGRQYFPAVPQQDTDVLEFVLLVLLPIDI
jgi:hypothetical protein